MAHGENAEKRWDREYWSRRPGGKHYALCWGPFSKWLTHRKERRRGDREAKQEARELPYEMPFNLDIGDA